MTTNIVKSVSRTYGVTQNTVMALPINFGKTVFFTLGLFILVV